MKKYIGCSGYHYADWKSIFYPKDLPKTKWLDYYAQHFNTVEINNTFYKTPSEKTFQKWYDETPDNFIFTLKGSKYITHTKKLKNVNPFVQNFYSAISPLKEKARCVLWQLPGNIHKNTEKLQAFCDTLSNEYINAIEFRHFSWYNEEIYELLSRYNVTFVIISAPGDLPEVAVKTSDTAYVRFHGKDDWYKYNYTDNELNIWKERVNKLNPDTLFAYFNNDFKAHAVKNCISFTKLI